MKKVFRFIDEIYHTEIIVFIGTRKQAEVYVKKNWCKDGLEIKGGQAGYACAFVSSDNESVRFIWMEHYPETLTQWITVSHEVNHTVFYVLENIGIEDEEAHCYYHDYLLKKILRELNKEKKNDKK